MSGLQAISSQMMILQRATGNSIEGCKTQARFDWCHCRSCAPTARIASGKSRLCSFDMVVASRDVDDHHSPLGPGLLGLLLVLYRLSCRDVDGDDSSPGEARVAHDKLNQGILEQIIH